MLDRIGTGPVKLPEEFDGHGISVNQRGHRDLPSRIDKFKRFANSAVAFSGRAAPPPRSPNLSR